MTVPGVFVPGLTKRLIDVCEERADALAIIDIEDDFKDAAENADIPFILLENGYTQKKTNEIYLTVVQLWEESGGRD